VRHDAQFGVDSFQKKSASLAVSAFAEPGRRKRRMSQPFIGQIKIVAFTFAPQGWAMANGQVLPISQNSALFSLLGTTYGGDGVTTFRLPDLRGRLPIHASATFPLGTTAGEEAHTLSPAEMPPHDHRLPAQSGSATPGLAPVTGNSFASSATKPYRSGGTAVPLAAGSVAPAGGSQPHDNRQPYLALNYIIALQGIFPSRN
jgi:microcystin-dependent protein